MPDNTGIVSAAVFKDDTAVSTSPVAVVENTLVYTESPMAAGNYFISFHFKDSKETTIVVVSELVILRANFPLVAIITK